MILIQVANILALGSFLLSFAGQADAQQNIQFSRYIFNSLSVNPAYAGYKEEWFAQLGLRAQWVGVEGAPQTMTASLDGILDPRDRKMGVGLQLTSDQLGAQSTTTATVNYAYRLQLDAVTSALGNNQNGSHEITLGFSFGKVPRSFICPRVS
ncbi:PorP/SprF family type IX secretion system membrane protein [Arcticibacter sp.]|uniref:PorP/SprF family type IX secretion system membrane protein n=1 Tax=Arcticibacter sp. TaxID=1872630 RepID=UPI003890C864